MRLLVLWMMVIFGLSSLPDLHVTELHKWLVEPHHYFIDVHHIRWDLLLSWSNPFFSIPTKTELDLFVHKIGHIVVYSTLGLLAYRHTRSVKKTFWICLLFACSDELHQAFIPGRGSRLYDVVLDTTVALTVVSFLSWFTRPGRSQTKKKKPALHSS
jgi:VanZ family protein